jgi:hypothetical protein
MTTTPSKAATEFVDLFMNSVGDDVFHLGPSGIRQALLDFVDTGKIKRELVSHPHPLVEDTDPRKIEYRFTVRRDETGEERAAREAAQEKRLAIVRWEQSHEGPPPPGVGFGQLREQREWWVTKGGAVLRIAEMDLSHRRNLLAYLERAADTLKMNAEWALVSSFPGDPSDGVADALDSIQGEMERTTSIDWLNQQPLVKALRKSIKVDEKAARKAAAR